MFKYKQISCIFLILCLLFLFWRCGNYHPSNIPNVPVDITLSIYEAQFVDLQAVGGYAYVNGGSRGIILYRASINRINAYERHCPYNTEDPCGVVSLDSSEIKLIDYGCDGNGCGSQFNIINGQVLNGPAVYALLQYNTSFDGAILRVYN